MDWAQFFASLPAAGWAAAFAALAMLGCLLFGLYRLLLRKEVRVGRVEVVSPAERKAIGISANRLLENQSANASNLLTKVWTDLYETGRRIFSMTDQKELFLLEDISKLIDHKLQHAVYMDLLRNHITGRTEEEVREYAAAKAEGYWRLVRTYLHSYNAQLPKYPLPSILDYIDSGEYKRIFTEIYLSSRSIAGGGGMG